MAAENNRMRLYHGTTKRGADATRTEGVKPRGKEEGNWSERLSRPDCVYLTTAFGATYAVSASVRANEPDSAECAIIEIDVQDDGNLLPDEDFLTECILMAYREGEFHDPSDQRKQDISLSLRDTLEEYAGTDWLDLLDSRYRDSYRPIDAWIWQYCAVTEQSQKLRGWEASVFGLGSCAHKGIIAPGHIRRIAYIQRTNPILQLLRTENVKPSIYDYQSRKAALIAQNAFIFGDGVSDPREERFRAGIRVVSIATS